jgi:hypothetical protein
LTGVVPASLCQLQYLNDLRFQYNQLQCYPECLLSSVQYLDAGSTPVCASEPTAQPIDMGE